MRIPASSSEKARVAQQYRIFTVCMCINSLCACFPPGHSHVIRGHPPLVWELLVSFPARQKVVWHICSIF